MLSIRFGLTALAVAVIVGIPLGCIADYNDPITYLELMCVGNAYNYGLYENPEFDEQIVAAKGMLPTAEHDQLLYNAEMMLFGKGGFPVMPVYYYTNMYCANGISNMGYFFFQNTQKAA